MHVDLTPEAAELIKLLLAKEFEETRVEIHHTRSSEFKASLHEREKLVRNVLDYLNGIPIA